MCELKGSMSILMTLKFITKVAFVLTSIIELRFKKMYRRGLSHQYATPVFVKIVTEGVKSRVLYLP